MSRIIRVSDDFYKEVKKIQEEMKNKYGIEVSLVNVSKVATKLLKKHKRRWRFPDFT